MERIQQIELEISRTQKNKATYGRRVSCGLKVSNVFRLVTLMFDDALYGILYALPASEQCPNIK